MWVLAIATTLIVMLHHFQSGVRADPQLYKTVSVTPKPHPLPSLLAQWQDPQNSGDYFSQINPVAVGYLVWSKFPVKIYLEPPTADDSRAQAWMTAVSQAVQEWSSYLPLVVMAQPAADITIVPKAPPLRLSPTGNLLRVRSAETRYELYVSQAPASRGVLSHRCQIWLSPNQTSEYIQAAARHEIGHALGIWGHSPEVTDALYFAQVRQPPLISARDVNTLKRVYAQPTRLGWAVPGKL